MPFSRPAQTYRGFTLIEVMVVVAIVGILASIAYPSYTEYVRRGQRAKAQTALMEAAQFMQRYYAANNSYKTPLAGNDLIAADVTAALSNRSELAYTLSFAANSPTATSYTLVMTPTQGGRMASDRCGAFTLDQTGLKGLSGQSSGINVPDCWK